MKYIMFEFDMGEGLKRNIPIIFPNSLVHADVAEAIKHMKSGTKVNWNRPFADAEVVSAGELLVGTCHAHGESETMGLQSRPEDTVIINMHDYFHGLKDLQV